MSRSSASQTAHPCVDRREWLSRACTCGALLVAGSVPFLSGCATAEPGSAPSGIAAERVADGVYMFRGRMGEVNAGNLGRTGNSGFILGSMGVLVIDAGTSVAHGEALLAAIGQVTPLPVKLVLITHIRQEFLFGALAFQRRGASIQMHRQSELLMKARCENCLKVLTGVVGESAMAGTTLIKPDRTFEASHALDGIGRAVRVHHFGHSSGPGDIAVEDVQTGTLFAGGLLDAERVPDVQDSDLPGWHQALAAMKTLQPQRIVPGHGPASDASLIDRVDAYLRALEVRAARLVQDGTALSEVPDAMELPAYEAWDQYDLIHRRNASIVFLRLERDALLKPEGAPR